MEEEWKAKVEYRLTEGEKKMHMLETKLDQNTAVTLQTKAGVQHLIEVSEALQGAATVVTWMATFAKWAAGFAASGLVLYTLFKPLFQ